MLKYIFSCENLESPQATPEEYANVIRVSKRDRNQSYPLELTIIEYCPDKRTVVLMSAIGNPVPLFWGWAGVNLVVSDSPSAVLSEMKSTNQVELSDIDKVGYIESVLFDGPLGKRTLFLQVNKVQLAEVVTIELGTKMETRRWRWLPKIQVDGSISDKEAQAQAEYQISNLLEKLSIPQEGLVLPITGGLDSRLLAALVREKSKSPIYSYTFQRGWSFESWCAKKVAKKLNTEHSIFNLNQSCYRDFAPKSAKLSGGLVTGMHTHGIYCCEELLPVDLRSMPRMFGFFGDPVTGAMTDGIEDGMKLATPASILAKYSACLYPDLLKEFEEEILSDLNETYAAFQESSSPQHCFHEFWKIQQRQSNLIAHLFNYHRCHHSVTVIEPFIQREFIDFFLQLPLNLRFNRNLFKRVTKHMFPDIFSLPSMHYENRFFSKAESYCEALESLLDKIDSRQEIFLSPFKYEQHEKNLQNYLHDEIGDGVMRTAELFNVEPVSVKYPIWRYGSSTKEHYRLATLAHLLAT